MKFTQIKLPFKVKSSSLGLGGQAKNTVCFVNGNKAYMSDVHLDLNDPKDFSVFEKTAKYFLKKKPKAVAFDMHPEYQSSKYVNALSQSHKVTKSQVQHHHAHIASCMAENGLRNEKVIGVAFDGTGFGSENGFWGGEFFICDYKGFKRRAHLKEVPLLGGEMAIREPFRLACFWLDSIYKDKFLRLKIDFVERLDKKKWRLLKNIARSNLDFPLASSVGRLFDAVGSLVLSKFTAKSEAELPIELENKAKSFWQLVTSHQSPVTSYKFKLIKEKDEYVLDPAPIFKGIIEDLKKNLASERIAYRFHLTVAEMVKKTCLVLRKETGVNKVVLSGGVFQNSLLLSETADLLYKEGFKVFKHKALPASDANISLGQAVIASFRSKLCV